MRIKESEITVVAVRSVVHSETGKYFYTANADGEVIKWDVDTRAYQQIFQNEDVARVVNVSPDEKYLALGTDQNNILLFDLRKSGQEPTKISGHMGGTVFDLQFLPDNAGFISVGADNRIIRSDFKTSTEIAKSNVRINKIALSPDAKSLVGGGNDGNVYIWDLSDVSKGATTLVTRRTAASDSTGSVVRSKSSPIKAVKFSNKGELLAYGTDDGRIIVWDLKENKRREPTLAGFRAPITDIEFSPEDRLILATSRNKQVRMWDLSHPFDLPIVLQDYSGVGGDSQGWVNDADFSQDGKYFITAANDGNIRKYPTKIGTIAKEICSHITLGNMSENEWRQYVGDLDYEETCAGMPKRFADL